MRTIVAAGVAIVGICVVFMIRWNCFYGRDYFGGCAAVWRNQSLYVFVQKNTTVERVPAWKFVLTKILGSWQAVESHTTRDLLIFEASNGSLTNHLQRNFDFKGQLLVSNDTIYLIQGGYSIAGFRWEKGRFAQLDPEKLSEVRALLKPSEEFSKDGWHKLDWQDFGMIGESYDKSFDLSGFAEPVSLRLRQGVTRRTPSGYLESNPAMRMDLKMSGREIELVHLSQNYSRITAEEFKAFKGK